MRTKSLGTAYTVICEKCVVKLIIMKVIISLVIFGCLWVVHLSALLVRFSDSQAAIAVHKISLWFREGLHKKRSAFVQGIDHWVEMYQEETDSETFQWADNL